MKPELSKTTYESLMNTFVKYPGHSMLLHRIFSPFVIGITFFIISTGIGVYLLNQWMLPLFVTAIMVGFIFKTYAFQHIMAGHGVGLRKMGKFRIFKLPQILSIMYLLLIVLALLLVMASYVPDTDGLNPIMLRYIGLVFLGGAVLNILIWRFHSYYETWYGDEYQARVEFKRKGYSDAKTERAIRNLYKAGILFEKPKSIK